MSEETDNYKFCNHHHELTDAHDMVSIGNEMFVANKKAIPLLKALDEVGLKTRTHHVDDNGGFIGILLNNNMRVECHIVHERDAERTKYNGLSEVLISWIN